MKIRNGFVSNSSSSSFCIFGIYSETKTYEALKKAVTEEDSTEGSEEEEVGDYEVVDKISEKTNLSYHSSDDGYWLGTSWMRIGDDETGRQFKDKIIDRLTTASGLPREQVEKDCVTHDEVVYG
jgi:hypothetical protein